MRICVEAHGPASRAEIWARYADPSRWPQWAPQIRAVRAEGPLHPGLKGVVVGPLGARARFWVRDVDEAAGRWSWRVRGGLGPFAVAMTIEHHVADGFAALVINGAAPVVVAYEPIARLALARIVRA